MVLIDGSPSPELHAALPASLVSTQDAKDHLARLQEQRQQEDVSAGQVKNMMVESLRKLAMELGIDIRAPPDQKRRFLLKTHLRELVLDKLKGPQ